MPVAIDDLKRQKSKLCSPSLKVTTVMKEHLSKMFDGNAEFVVRRYRMIKVL
jgi:hypothetical protein